MPNANMIFRLIGPIVLLAGCGEATSFRATPLRQTAAVTRPSVSVPIIPADASKQRIDADFRGVRLEDAIAEIQRHMTMRIDVRWSELAREGIYGESPLGLTMRNVPASKAVVVTCRAVETPAKVQKIYIQFDGESSVLVTSVAAMRKTLVEMDYDFSSLAALPAHMSGDPNRAEELLSEIRSFIDPNSWTARGGDLGRIEAAAKRGVWTIRQTPYNHRAIAEFLSSEEVPFESVTR